MPIEGLKQHSKYEIAVLKKKSDASKTFLELSSFNETKI